MAPDAGRFDRLYPDWGQVAAGTFQPTEEDLDRIREVELTLITGGDVFLANRDVACMVAMKFAPELILQNRWRIAGSERDRLFDYAAAAAPLALREMYEGWANHVVWWKHAPIEAVNARFRETIIRGNFRWELGHAAADREGFSRSNQEALAKDTDGGYSALVNCPDLDVKICRRMSRSTQPYIVTVARKTRNQDTLKFLVRHAEGIANGTKEPRWAHPTSLPVKTLPEALLTNKHLPVLLAARTQTALNLMLCKEREFQEMMEDLRLNRNRGTGTRNQWNKYSPPATGNGPAKP